MTEPTIKDEITWSRSHLLFFALAEPLHCPLTAPSQAAALDVCPISPTQLDLSLQARPGWLLFKLLCHRQSSLLATRYPILALHRFWPDPTDFCHLRRPWDPKVVCSSHVDLPCLRWIQPPCRLCCRLPAPQAAFCSIVSWRSPLHRRPCSLLSMLIHCSLFSPFLLLYWGGKKNWVASLGILSGSSSGVRFSSLKPYDPSSWSSTLPLSHPVSLPQADFGLALYSPGLLSPSNFCFIRDSMSPTGS